MAARAISFLIISDTHDSAFPVTAQTTPADVLLHCGDMTVIGGLSNYKAAVKSLLDCKAELKLVIPGNHDVSMDALWWKHNIDEDDDPEEPTKARALFADHDAELKLLDEGVHSFTLKDGRSFSIYVSPYTPEFNGYAFSYSPDEDRFNGMRPIPENVDIVMTHGPPLIPDVGYRLDVNKDGHCGCTKLWNAIQRSRPRLHCFGHIHEGYGAQRIRWNGEEGFGLQHEQIETSHLAGNHDETLFINAATLTSQGKANNEPWVVDLLT